MLSNIFRRRNRDEPPGEQVVRPLGSGEIGAALPLLLGHDGRSADEGAVRDFAGFAQLKQIDLSGLIGTFWDDRLVACSLLLPSGGKTALLMTSTAGASRAVAAAVAASAKRACEQLDPERVSLVQVLLDPAERHVADALRATGFDALATLIYLQRAILRPPPAPELPAGLRLITYDHNSHLRFARAILASYEQSLDCPALHGKRDIEEVIDGHKVSGEFDPNLWFIIEREDEPVAVLLLSPVRNHATMELVYIGLAPHARGQRVGDYLLQLAMHCTHNSGLRQLTLAVDEANGPALRLYFRNGLGEVHRRLAMTRSLR